MKWSKECEAAKKELEKFTSDGKIALKVYHGGSADDVRAEPASVFNIFWANVNVMRSALYANPPVPLVKREFDDYMDDVARVAAIMMERCLDCKKVHSPLALAVEDRLIPGLGQVWLRYEPEIQELDEDTEVITDEFCITEYVHWQDFLYSPARTWEEVWWVARRVYLTKREVEERFGPEAVDKCQWGASNSKARKDPTLDPMHGTQSKAEIWEVWDRKRKAICWYSGNSDERLDEKTDYLGLSGFFPCPKPLVANTLTSKFVPKADYTMARKQYSRVMTLTTRIMLLEDAIRVVGAYDSSNAELKQMIGGKNNAMIPVNNWAMYAERGGAKGSVDWFPLDMVVSALEKLQGQLQMAMNQLYELLGISDIMRGVTQARETLGAQQLKSQYSSSRLQFNQEEVARFVTETLQLRAEIISKHFSPESIAKKSNIQHTPDVELAPQALQLIKDNFSMQFRVTVSTDTLSIPDYNAERQGRIEFITAMGQFISQVWPLVQQEKGAAPFLLQVLQWGIASFRSAQTIEGVFDKAIKSAVAASQQPPAPPAPQQIAEVKKTDSETAENIADAEKKRAEAAAIPFKVMGELRRGNQNG